MKSLVKRALVLLVLMATAGALFASGVADDIAAAGGANLDAVDPTGAEVVYWHQHSRERQEGLAAMVDRFNQTNEWDITVVQEYQGSYGDIYNKMITGIAANQVPNLVVAYQNQAAAYQVADALVDLTPYVSHAEYGVDDAADFFAGFYNADVNAQFGNQRLGFPPNRSAEVMYYNKTWLEELGFDGPPETWEEFREMAMAATDDEAGTYGYALRTDASNMFALAIGLGGGIAAPGGEGYVFNTPELRTAMQFMKDLYEDGYANKIAERYGDQTDFGNRKVLFTMGSTSGLPFYQMAVDQGEAGSFEWSVAPIPHSTRRPQVNVYGASVSVPKTTPEQQLAAWLFVRWMSAPEQQAEWVRISNYFPVRYSVAENLDDYFEQNPRYEDAFTILETSGTQAEPPYAGYDEVRDLMSAAFNEIIDGGDVEETLARLEAEANEVHELASP